MEYYELHDPEIREAEANIVLANELIVIGDKSGIAIRLRALDELLAYEEDVPHVSPLEIARLTQLPIRTICAAIDCGDMEKNEYGVLTYDEVARWYEANYQTKVAPITLAR